MLITLTLMGVLTAVVSAAITVTFRSATGTEGRANVARAESSIDTWLPADLASTDVNNLDLAGTGEASVNLDPAAKPCSSPSTCGGIPFYDTNSTATNALQLAWETNGVITRVQYQYIQIGDEWQLRRIACVGSNPCTATVILHDVDAPPDPATYDAQTTRPVWVLDVAVPTNPANLDLSDNARRIVVTIDGGGENAGAGGGLNSINLTAGGRDTGSIDADDFTVPSFVRANSRCGGPVTLIVDESGSINFGGDNMANVVKPGVEAFIEAFRGTPTQIQVVSFDTRSEVYGTDSPASADAGGVANWHRYTDMTDDAEVDGLIADIKSSALSAGGVTNWEDAFFRTFYESNGEPAQISPNRVVFFTDGVPSTDRQEYRASGGVAKDFNNGAYTHSTSGWPTWYTESKYYRNTGSYGQEYWDRADIVLDANRSADMIVVGVGQGLKDSFYWLHNPATYANKNSRPNFQHPTVPEQKKGSEILAYLLANGPSGQVPATSTGSGSSTVYTNPETADFYLQDDFDKDAFAAAMRAAALKDCGGTLTIQTRNVNTGQRVGTEFVYENADYRDDTGTSLNPDPRTVTTSQYFPTGTFDFEISASTDFFDVDIFPAQLESLGGFQYRAWSCMSGSNFVEKDIAGSDFKGFSINVRANEAVSCIMEVE